jgi:D-3-phosphoglycerate dehydrogenase / 2-oxoglutarate reductase
MDKVLISTTTFAQYSDEPLQILKDNNVIVQTNKLGRKLKAEEINELASEVDGIIAGTEPYNNNVLKDLPNLKVISRLGVGLDNIDLNIAHNLGIKVYKTQTTPAQAVAELALGMMIDVARKVSKQSKEMQSGIWEKQMGSLLNGKTLGIIGLGSIGKTLVKLVSGFNFNILAYDLFHDKIFKNDNNINYCNLDTLLKKSDIVSIHLNLSNQTEKMINLQRLKQMKTNSILINASRGEIIDEEALYKVLKKRSIMGAGLDVFREEPYSGPLTELDNVVLTPHIGSYAKEIRNQMEVEAAKNIIKGFLNEKKQ